MISFANIRPSPALAVAILVLIAAAAGTAVAADPVATSSALSKKKVRKIATKQINKLAPGLSVMHAANADAASSAEVAGSADRATSAGRANSANPIGFAYVRANGTVDSTRSKNVSSSNVTAESVSAYCFRNLAFAVRGAQVTPDFATGPGTEAEFATGNPANNCAGPNVQAGVVTTDSAGGFARDGFFIAFYN